MPLNTHIDGRELTPESEDDTIDNNDSTSCDAGASVDSLDVPTEMTSHDVEVVHTESVLVLDLQHDTMETLDFTTTSSSFGPFYAEGAAIDTSVPANSSLLSEKVFRPIAN